MEQRPFFEKTVSHVGLVVPPEDGDGMIMGR
jgi:hypothetical protein